MIIVLVRVQAVLLTGLLPAFFSSLIFVPCPFVQQPRPTNKFALEHSDRLPDDDDVNLSDISDDDATGLRSRSNQGQGRAPKRHVHHNESGMVEMNEITLSPREHSNGSN